MIRLPLIIISFFSLCIYAQDPASPLPSVADSAAILPDTTRLPEDSLTTQLPLLGDSINDEPSKVAPQKSDIETTINYNAKDSLFFDIASRKLYLYGDTHIDYGEISMEAERTNVDWTTRQIEADYVLDSAGKKIGKPVFTEKGDIYVTDDIVYNFKTKRALIKGVITEQEGGFMHGDYVKKNEENELFIKGARYTTCNLEEPHFHIESKKLKVIPKNKVVSGPFNMQFGDLPTPLFFPFGMFPQPNKKSSGLVIPVYGEEQRRGFFLRDGGYYFAISDYMDLRVTGDIYSKGGNGLNITTNYLKRYAYRGTFNFSYTSTVADDIENPVIAKDFWVRWNHSPETRGNSSISASVSAGTSSYNNNNNLVAQDFNRSINSQFTSNVSYSKKFQGTPFNMSANLRHSQNLATGIVTLTLPDFTLNTQRQYPFKNLVKSSSSPLAKLTFSHSMSAKNELTNTRRSVPSYVVGGENLSDTLEFNARNFDEIQDRSRIGAQHRIPISTSLNVLKYFTLSPNFNYTELWYPKSLVFNDYNPELGGVKVDTVQGFSRAGSWNTGAALNTRVYGTVNLNGKIQAIRHVMTPSLSFSYNPDFSDPKYGVYKDIIIDSLGNTTQVSKYEGFAYGSPPGGESRTLGFNLTNNLEMKVTSKKDSVKGYKKVKIFDNLGLSSGYNFAADSFKLSNISINARTSLLENALGINFTGTIDPYIRNPENNNRVEKFAWNSGQGLGQLTRMNIAFNLNLSPKGSKNDDDDDDPSGANGFEAPDGQVDFQGLSEKDREELEYYRNNPNQYINFNIPWSLRIGYSINRSQRGFEDPIITQTLTFNGSIGLTQKTQITFNSGYDFENMDFTTTRIGVARDLHCWTMDFNWVPFGYQQSYFVSIRVKSSLLQDLKVEKRRSFLDFFN